MYRSKSNKIVRIIVPLVVLGIVFLVFFLYKGFINSGNSLSKDFVETLASKDIDKVKSTFSKVSIMNGSVKDVDVLELIEYFEGNIKDVDTTNINSSKNSSISTVIVSSTVETDEGTFRITLKVYDDLKETDSILTGVSTVYICKVGYSIRSVFYYGTSVMNNNLIPINLDARVSY
jgi:hypothetical protein